MLAQTLSRPLIGAAPVPACMVSTTTVGGGVAGLALDVEAGDGAPFGILRPV